MGDEIQINDKSKCPLCVELLNASFQIGEDNNSPLEDDISICIHCGGLLQFNHDLTLRPIETKVYSDIKTTHPDTYKKIVEAVIAIKAKSQSFDDIRNYLKSI